MQQTGGPDPRRPDKIHRYKPIPVGTPGSPSDDATPDYLNVLGMIFSMCGLMMRVCSILKTLFTLYNMTSETKGSEPADISSSQRS